MNSKRLQKQPFLFVLSIISIAFGLMVAYVLQTFNLLSLSLCILGAALLLLCLMLKLKSPHKNLSTLKWRSMTLIFAIITSSVAFTAGLNYSAYQMPFRWDVTQAQQHTLNASSAAIINHLQKPVKITALTVGLPPKYLEDVFKEYERQSQGLITTQIIDPIAQITYAAQFDTVIRADQSKVIVQAGNERKVIDFTDKTLTQEALSNAIIRTTRPKRQLCFLVGHDEYAINSDEPIGLSTLVNLLNSNNYTSKELMLGTASEVPASCDVLIIAGPSVALTVHEETLINDYLKRGGDALLLIENVVVTTRDKPLTAAQLNKNPDLNNLLNHWGINVSADIVVDLNSHVGGDAGSPATKNYGRHKAIIHNLDYTFYVRPRSITVLENIRPTIKLASIVKTASKDKSWGETNRLLKIHFDQGIDIPGPVALSFVIWEEKSEQDASDTRLIVFTDADFLSNAYIDQYSNAAMALNVINWLSELDYQVFIDQKEIKVERLNLTSQQKRLVTVLLLLMPLLIALCGIFVWQRRLIHR